MTSAEMKYGVPKSTLHDYITGKSIVGCKLGPSPVFSSEEESKLVQPNLLLYWSPTVQVPVLMKLLRSGMLVMNNFC